MINSISDMETDAAQAEVAALQTSPWPPDMREQVWADRVRLRHKLKKEMPLDKDFWAQHGQNFVEWCQSKPPKALKKMLQMPRSEITERIKTQYGIHSSFGIVLCAVVEQVANFFITKYPTDARGDVEIAFEESLIFDKRGGFTLKIALKEGIVDEAVLQVLLNRIQSLGGPKLLDRGAAKARDEGDDDGGGADNAAQESEDGKAGPSFRSDRRIIRLLIARYWADTMMKKFLKEKEQKEITDSASPTG